MISQKRVISEKYTEEHGEIGISVDVSESCVSAAFYDLERSEICARSVLLGEKIVPNNAEEILQRLIVTAMREHGISAAMVRSVGIAAGVHTSSVLERRFSPEHWLLSPQTDVFILPFISAAISGRFTAALLTLPDEDCVFADFGRTLSVAVKRGGNIVCAVFPLSGAFDGSGLESGIPSVSGAIIAVSEQSDGTLMYQVADDVDSIGISPCAALMAALHMRDSGILDGDGIMTDRDRFHIGEDFYISQADIRVIQADKAKSAAALSLLPEIGDAFFSGEPFANSGGIAAMRSLGAIPERFDSAKFCRSSVENGIIMCLENENARTKAVKIAQNSQECTEKILHRFDELYLKFLPF